jgi:isopenicillin-N epimerase
MLPIDVTAIGAAYFTGNCHKWVCAPKGAAFLHVRRDRQAGIRPLSVSHGANSTRTDRSRFRLEFDWTGTFDPSPYLCIPDALRFMGGLLPGGWPALMEHNRRTALAARDLLCGALGCLPPSPDSMIGTLASLPLPEGRKDPPRSALDLDPLQEALFARFGVEVPVIPWPAAPRRLLRISAQIYNERGDYARLVQGLREILPAACAVVPEAAHPLP